MRVAVAGLGRMGVAIAERVIAAGHETAVYNRSPGRASELVRARAVARAAEIWEHADVTITMLSDSAALEAVVLGEEGLLAAADGSRCTLVDMSTVSPQASAAVADAASAREVAYLRAPVSGNPAAVRGGSLGIIASGEERVFSRCESLLRDIGPNVFYIGDGERSRVMKLALNVIIAGTAELLAEAIALGEAHGLERSMMLEVMNGSAVASPFLKHKTDALIADDYATTFSTALMHKDLDLALSAAAAGGVPLPVTAAVQQLLQACISSGMGELDFMALLPRLKGECS